MARPSKLTKDVEARIVVAVEQGCTLRHAAQFGGISYETLREWRKTKPAFSVALEAAEGKAAMVCMTLVQQAAHAGDWRASAWILERRWPHEYGRQVQEIEHKEPVQIVITHRDGTAYRDPHRGAVVSGDVPALSPSPFTGRTSGADGAVLSEPPDTAATTDGDVAALEAQLAEAEARKAELEARLRREMQELRAPASSTIFEQEERKTGPAYEGSGADRKTPGTPGTGGFTLTRRSGLL